MNYVERIQAPEFRAIVETLLFGILKLDPSKAALRLKCIEEAAQSDPNLNRNDLLVDLALFEAAFFVKELFEEKEMLLDMRQRFIGLRYEQHLANRSPCYSISTGFAKNVVALLRAKAPEVKIDTSTNRAAAEFSVSFEGSRVRLELNGRIPRVHGASVRLWFRIESAGTGLGFEFPDLCGADLFVISETDAMAAKALSDQIAGILQICQQIVTGMPEQKPL